MGFGQGYEACSSGLQASLAKLHISNFYLNSMSSISAIQFFSDDHVSRDICLGYSKFLFKIAIAGTYISPRDSI